MRYQLAAPPCRFAYHLPDYTLPRPMPAEFLSPALAVALSAYTVGVASPGPSNMAIMATAMSQGRRHAIAFAGGVICGSIAWGLVAAFGLSAVIHAYAWSLVLMKVLGGLYLLFLAWKAARAAAAPIGAIATMPAGLSAGSKRRAFVGGLGMHLTNPKAVFVWLSIVTLALPADAGTQHALGVVASCGVIGAVVFLGYGVAFSTATARWAYGKAHRWFNATLCAVFAFAGIRLLMSRNAV